MVGNRQSITRGRIFNGDYAVEATLIIEHNEDSTEPVFCTAIVEGKFQYYQLVHGSEDEFRYIEIESVSHNGSELWIPQLEIHRDIRNRLLAHGEVHIFQGYAELYAKRHLADKDPTSGNYDCYITLPDSPLFASSSEYQFEAPDTLRPTYKKKESTGIWWETKYGRAEMVRTFSYYSRKENVKQSFVELRKCEINLEIPIKSIDSWKEVIHFLHRDFDDVLCLLSLLSKQRIDWFDGLIMLTEDSDSGLLVLIRRKAHWSISFPSSSNEDQEVGLLVKKEVLANGVFAQMVSNFNNSPHKDLIIRTIQYLMLTYEQFYVEAHMGLMYVAFEMLIDGLGKEYASIIEAEDFKQTEAELKQTLYAGTLEQTTKDEIETKFRELRRRSLKRKAVLVFDKYAIDLASVFPENTNVKREFQLLLDGRNEFTHRGRIADYGKGIRDFRRLRYLVSILILKLLGYPLEQLNEHNEDGTLARRPLRDQ